MKQSLNHSLRPTLIHAARSKAPLLAALLLLSCQAAPPTVLPTTSTQPASALPAASLPAPVSNLPVVVPGLDSASGRVISGPGGDALALKVQIRRPSMGIKAFDLTRIKWIKGLVKGADLDRFYFNQGGSDGFMPVIADESTLRIEGVPKGRNRVVMVQAYGEDAQGQPVLLAGVVLKAIYSSSADPDQHEVEVRFSLQSTLAASVVETLISTNPTLAGSLDAPGLSTLLNGITTGPDHPSTNAPDVTPVPPGRVNPEYLAGLLAQNSQNNPQNSPLPPTPTGTVPPAWLYPASPLAIQAVSPGGTSYGSSIITVQITDPVSQPKVIAAGQSSTSLSFSEVPPGTWNVITTLQDDQGVIRHQEEMRVTVPANGGPPSFSTLAGTPLASPNLTLPLLLDELHTKTGSTPQTSFSAGSTIVLVGDGFDALNPANNVVTINGRTLVLDPTVPATATSLAVIVPADLVGTNLPVKVTTAGKVSETLQVTLTAPATITALVNPTNGLPKTTMDASLSDGVPGRSISLLVSGFDPRQDSALGVRFVDSSGNLLPGLYLPTSVLADRIIVSVPAAAGTGPIQVIRSSGATPLLSPVLTMTNGPANNVVYPVITSTLDQHAAGSGLTFTVQGLNFQTGTNPGGSPRTTINFDGQPLPASAYQIIDSDTLTITVPTNSAPAGTIFSFEVITSIGSASSSTRMLPPPVITGATTAASNAPLILTGTGFMPGQSVVTINGQPIAPANLLVTPTKITISNPPPLAEGALITVTTPLGSDSETLNLYSDLVNFIGPTSSSFFDINTGTAYTANSTNNIPVGDAHGINVVGCNEIYVVGNSSGRLYKFQRSAGEIYNLAWSVNLPAISEDVANGPDGTIYVAATNGHRIDMFAPGTGAYLGPLQVYGETLFTNPDGSKSIRAPEGIEISADGQYLYVASNSDANSSTVVGSNMTKIIKVHIGHVAQVGDPPGKPATLVSGGAQAATASTGNEPIATARFHHLEGLGMDAQGNIYVAEADFRQIRKINPSTGIVSVFASFPQSFTIHEIRVEPDGSVIVPGEGSQKIYRVSPTGEITTVAGNGQTGLKPGSPLTGTFSTPVGVDFDLDGNLYIADRSWGIRKINRLAPRTTTRLCP